MNNIKLLGIAGVAQSGKDSLFKALCSVDPKFIRCAFADKVREDLRQVFIDIYNIDILNCSPTEKESCREIMVNYSNHRREETNGNHWISEIEPKVRKIIESNLIPVITDVRYENETKWVQSLGGKVVHLKKYSIINGERIIHPPANSVEAFNDPIVQKNADLHIQWEDNLSQEGMIKTAKELLLLL